MAQQLKHLMGLGFGALTSKAINGTIADNLTATGSSQADALQLTEDISVVSIVTANSGIKLPPVPQPGDEIFVGNLGQNAVNIYPSSGGSIQGATTDAPYSLNAGCCATFTARVGSKNWVVFSNGGSISGVVTPSAPVLTGNPSITSTDLIVGTVATATHGTYSGTVTGYIQQWLRNGSPITGATGLTYSFQSADLADTITYSEAAYNTSTLYSSATGTSNGLGPIAAAPVAPVLTSPTAASTGTTTASLGVTTDQGNGTLYWVVLTSSTPPSKTQIAAGQDSSGSTAAAHGSQAVSATGAQSASATGLTASTTYYAYFMHTNAGALQSNVAAAASFTTSAATGITAPTYALHTASGASPASWDVSGDSTFQPGMFVHQQFAADSGFSTSLVDYYTQVEGSDWEAGSDTIGNGIVTFVQPSGTYFTRCRFETVPGDTTNNVTSGWSNTVTDTITASTAVLTSTTGTSKSQYIDVASPHYQGISNAVVGAMCASRMSIAAIPTKFHFEWTMNSFQAAGGNSNFYGGFDQSTVSLATALGSGSLPGNGGASNGISFIGVKGYNGLAVYRNGGGQTLTLPSNMTDGDTIAVDVDTVANTVQFSHYRSGTTTALGSPITLTSQIPTSYWAFAGVGAGTGTAGIGVSDAVTVNPVAATALVTPATGFNNNYG